MVVKAGTLSKHLGGTPPPPLYGKSSNMIREEFHLKRIEMVFDYQIRFKMGKRTKNRFFGPNIHGSFTDFFIMESGFTPFPRNFFGNKRNSRITPHCRKKFAE